MTPDFVAEPVAPPAPPGQGPGRIISMAPSLTELCFALGLGDRLVGRTQFCVHPPAAQKVEVVGALLDPSIERILRLQPDLLLVTDSSRSLRERFTEARLPVRSLPDSSLEDIFSAVRQLGEWTGRGEAAAKLAAALRAELDRLGKIARNLASDKSLKIAFVTGPLPGPVKSVWVAGPRSYVDSLISMAGARNMVDRIVGERSWLEISAEQVAWLQPDVIVEVREAAVAAQREQAVDAWRQLPGLGRTRLVTLSDPAMLIPGPRVNVMLARLIEALYGGEEAGEGVRPPERPKGSGPVNDGGGQTPGDADGAAGDAD